MPIMVFIGNSKDVNQTDLELAQDSLSYQFSGLSAWFALY